MTAAEMQRASGELAASQQAIHEQTDRELAAAVRAEFGEAAVQAMEDHERMMPFRAPLEEFAKALFYTETPLTASQAEQLLAAVVRHERDTRGKVDFDWMVQPDIYGAMLTQSSGILSEPQIEALRRITEFELKTVSVKKNVGR